MQHYIVLPHIALIIPRIFALNSSTELCIVDKRACTATITQRELNIVEFVSNGKEVVKCLYVEPYGGSIS